MVHIEDILSNSFRNRNGLLMPIACRTRAGALNSWRPGVSSSSQRVVPIPSNGYVSRPPEDLQQPQQ
jgi:hypothetical protein